MPLVMPAGTSSDKVGPGQMRDLTTFAKIDSPFSRADELHFITQLRLLTCSSRTLQANSEGPQGLFRTGGK